MTSTLKRIFHRSKNTDTNDQSSTDAVGDLENGTVIVIGEYEAQSLLINELSEHRGISLTVLDVSHSTVNPVFSTPSVKYINASKTSGDEIRNEFNQPFDVVICNASYASHLSAVIPELNMIQPTTLRTMPDNTTTTTTNQGELITDSEGNYVSKNALLKQKFLKDELQDPKLLPHVEGDVYGTEKKALLKAQEEEGSDPKFMLREPLKVENPNAPARISDIRSPDDVDENAIGHEQHTSKQSLHGHHSLLVLTLRYADELGEQVTQFADRLKGGWVVIGIESRTCVTEIPAKALIDRISNCSSSDHGSVTAI